MKQTIDLQETRPRKAKWRFTLFQVSLFPHPLQGNLKFFGYIDAEFF